MCDLIGGDGISNGREIADYGHQLSAVNNTLRSAGGFSR